MARNPPSVKQAKMPSADSTPLATFTHPREIRMTDTDATGWVTLDSCIRMMEETEYAFLRSRDLRVVLYDGKGTMGFPRLHASASIDRPLRFGDTVTVQLSLTQMDGKQIEYRFQIVSDDSVAVEGQFRVAFCRFPDYQNPYAILIPDEVTAALMAPPESVTSQDRPKAENTNRTIFLTPQPRHA